METQLGKWPSRDFQKFVNANISWVYVCTTLIADRAAAFKLRLFVNRGKKREQIFNHVFLDTLKNVNPYMNNYELMNFTTQSKKVTGNAYWYMPPNRLGVPGEIWTILPQYMRIVPDKQKFIRGYLYRHNGQDVAFTPEEIVHFKETSLKDYYYGMSPLEAAAYAADLNEYQKAHNLNLFRNRGVPGSLITMKDATYDEQDEDRLREAWNKAYRGVDKAGKAMFLWGDADYKQISLSPADLDYINGQKLTREEIFGIFKVPLALIVTEQVNRSNMETAEFTFAQNVLKPTLTSLQEKLNEKVMPKYDEKLEVQYPDPTPAWIEDVILERESNLKTAYSNINMEREKNGEEKVPWGEKPFMPINMVPIGTATPEEEGKSKEFTEQAKDNIWREMIRRVVPITQTFKKLMQVFFANQEKEVLANLAELGKGFKKEPVLVKIDKEDIDRILFDDKKAKANLRKAAEPLLARTAKDGARASRELFALDVNWDTVVANIDEWVGKRAETFSTWVNETTLGDLKSTLSQGIADGEGIPQLRKRIEDVYDFADKNRAEMIARTETITASNEGNIEVYRNANVKKKEWLAERDDRTCEHCQALDGKVVPMGRRFPSPLGSANAPTLHPDCRCTVLPVV